VNGDGHLDIAASYQYGTIWLGDGTGLFTAADQGLPSAGTSGLKGVSLGDVNGDGCADLAFTLNEGVRVYLWGGSSWVDASTGLPATGGYAITHLWDMDGDGFTDIAALGDGVLSVWLGDGAGHWSAGGSTTVGPGIDTAGFEVGGDIDHNGRADAVLVQEEGTWPSYRNHLYVMRESTPATVRATGFQFPRGNELLFLGSVATIRWRAAQLGAQPAAIRLERSSTGPAGPWQEIADGLPDGGRFQWIVSGPATDQACLRVTLTQAGESVSAVSRVFRVMPSSSMGVADGERGDPSVLRVEPNPVGRDVPCVIFTRAGRAGARIVIRDSGGRLVRRLPRIGPRTVWDGRDERGRHVPNGVYWTSFYSGSERGGPARRIVVLK